MTRWSFEDVQTLYARAEAAEALVEKLVTALLQTNDPALVQFAEDAQKTLRAQKQRFALEPI